MACQIGIITLYNLHVGGMTGAFWTCLVEIQLVQEGEIFGLSTNWSLRPQESRPFVRPSRFFSETVHYFFLKLYSQLGLVVREKCSKRFFDNFHRFGHFFRVKIFFPLIQPKKHSLITQKRFWSFFGVFSGFLGVPQNYIIWSFKSVFLQFLCENNGRKSRDPARRLVVTIID